MAVHAVGRAGDRDREGVPAPLGRVVGIEVVLAVLAGTARALDDVLVVVADDDGEIAVSLDPLLGDRLDGACAPIAVLSDDALGDGGRERPGVGEVALPGFDGVGHARASDGGG